MQDDADADSEDDDDENDDDDDDEVHRGGESWSHPVPVQPYLFPDSQQVRTPLTYQVSSS